MFKKIALATVALSFMSFSAMSQEKLVPRTMPLNDKPVHKAAPTPAMERIAPAFAAPTFSSATETKFSSAGTPSFSSGGTGSSFSSADNPSSTEIKKEVDETRLNDLFDEMDTDHDGTVSESEFSSYYKTRGDNPDFTSYDKNNDGHITRQEYIKGNTIGNTVSEPKDPPKH